MKTYKDLISRWDACNGGQLLVDHQHPIKNMYLNVNEKGNRELLIPVSKPITQFHTTEAIGISNYKNHNTYFFAIELLSDSLINEYASLCFDIINSSRECTTTKEALDTLFVAFRKWYYLMADVRLDILPMHQLRGLMGELKHILDEITAGKSDLEVINAWTTHKDAARDFIFDDTWNEIKTIQSSSDYITISSIEQLDHDMDGYITVYKLDKASPDNASAYTLNSIVNKLKSVISVSAEPILSRKLLAKGYAYNDTYDNFSFIFNGKCRYIVNESFPRISRGALPVAIKSAQYEIILSRMNEWSDPCGT